MSEVLFQSNGITITKSVAKFGNSTYPIANIGSVVIEEDPNVLAGFAILAGIGVAIWAGVASNWLVGLLVVGAVIFAATKLRSRKKLTLKTSSGDVTAFSSKDISLVEDVRQAIENAFAR